MADLFDRVQLDRMLDALVDRLPGDWLLIGGALTSLWLLPGRTTEDIDIVSLAGTMEDRYALLDLTAELGLPIEAINSAADFFVRRVPGWKAQTVPFRRGQRGRVLRPTVTLFVRLKMGRLSEQDLADCLAALRCAEAAEETDTDELERALASLPDATDPAQRQRRETLGAALAGRRG